MPTTILYVAFFHAAATGDVARLTRCLGEGASTSVRQDEDLLSPLFVAARAGHSGVVETLLSYGASVHQANAHGATPLIAASMGGHAEVVAVLLRAGAEVDCVAHDGVTALAWAVYNGNDNAAETLRSAGAASFRVDGDEQQQLRDATTQGHAASVVALLDAGIDVNCVDENGATPLILAVRGGHDIMSWRRC